MAEKLDPKELVTIEDLAISSMREIAALVEVLERKGVLTRQEIYDAITELRRIIRFQTPRHGIAYDVDTLYTV